MPWQIRYNGKTYQENDLTIDDAEALEGLLKATWFEIDPLRSARHAKVVAGYVIAKGEGRAYDEVHAEIGRMRITDYVTAILPADDDMPSEWTDGVPQTAAAPGTAG